ncbi:hypothetical protein EYF80_005529 [Liparis tanakae]|uniref:Uncharacterized protein n=1 Tax=Liparis tanakae TaxID=230148 RepID=A0A4Z2J413_9TELE|nr:hypothetical protein EYF80_005529 [Liparis tanakae]
MEYSDTMSERLFTSVTNRSRAWLLHWFPRMMDLADDGQLQRSTLLCEEEGKRHLGQHPCTLGSLVPCLTVKDKREGLGQPCGKYHNDRLTYDEALIQAAEDVAQDDNLPQVQVNREMGQHSAQEQLFGNKAVTVALRHSTCPT